MLTLIKYEIRKHAYNKAVILIALGVIELFFMLGIAAGNRTMAKDTSVLFDILAAGAAFVVLFEPISSFNSDLSKKTGYMLFLTPNSSFKIVGAKIITAILQIAVASVMFNFITSLNRFMSIAKYGTFFSFEGINTFMSNGFTMNDTQGNIVWNINSITYVGGSTLLWGCILSIVFLSICISTTIFANRKVRNVISMLLFFLVLATLACSFQAIAEGIDFQQDHTILIVVSSGIFFTVVSAFSGWIIDKSVSM